MAEKIQRSYCSCAWELCFFLKYMGLRFPGTFITEIFVAHQIKTEACVNETNIANRDSPLMRAVYPWMQREGKQIDFS